MTENVFEDPHKLVFIQSRAEIDFSTVDEYAQMMLDGVVFDPVEGIQDEKGAIYVWDGYHRGEAAKKADMTLLVNLRSGTKIEAEWLALTANQKHGLRRTTADKQRIVRNALLHPYGMHLSNREIARHCGVNDKTVGRIRSEMETTAEIPQLDQRVVKKADGTTYAINTSNIGSKPVSLHQVEMDPGEERVRAVFGETAHTNRETTRVAANRGPDNGRQPQSITGYEPTAQEFECPRCGQEKIVGINGSRRWCLGCDTEWPTDTAFLAEVEINPNQQARHLKLERLQRRFTKLLFDLTEQELDTVESWLDDLERSLVPAGEATSCYAV